MRLFLKFIFTFWPCCAACRTLAPWPRMELAPPALKARSLNPWTTRKVPLDQVFRNKVCVCVSHLGASDFVTPWAHQAPLSVGILQARILEWVAMPSSRGSSRPRDWTQVSHIAGIFFTIWTTMEAGVGCHTFLQGNLPDPGIEPELPTFPSPSLAGRFFATEPTRANANARFCDAEPMRLSPELGYQNWALLQVQAFGL